MRKTVHNIKKIHHIRALAALAITETLQTKRAFSKVLPKYKAACSTPEDRSLLQALCYGVLRWYPRLQFFLSKLIQKPLKEKDQDIYHLICVGLLQLHWMRIPPHAALSETVAATRVLQKPWSTKLVNAVLRSFQRQSEAILKELGSVEIDHIKSSEDFRSHEMLIAAKTAHPIWFLKKIKEEWPDDWKNIIEANNNAPPLSIRVNLRQISRKAYLEQLSTDAIHANIIHSSKAGITIDPPKDITLLPGYTEGLFSVQDGSSQAVTEYLALQPGLRVLDACSAPGGKLSLILETEPHLEEVWALDVSEEKIKIIHENLARLKLINDKTRINIQIADGQKPEEWWDGKPFDRILCDAPCSATGIVRRHPDIKLLRQQEDIDVLSKEQLKLLQALWPLLKPGGLLLYTTCSILKEENQIVIDRFCNGLDAGSFEQDLNKQIIPGQNDMDGFYYARIRKLLLKQ